MLRTRFGWVLLAVIAVAVTSCGDGTAVFEVPDATVATTVDTPAGGADPDVPDKPGNEGPGAKPTVTTAGFPPGGGVDLSLTRKDVDCSEESLGADFEDFTTIHYVVDGNLGGVCFGSESDIVFEAWDLLTTITPGGQLNDLGLFGGYVWSGADNVSLAYVITLDDDASLFGMAVNTDEARSDRDLFALTMAHEFAHVFTSLPVEMDYRVNKAECTTHHNGEACMIDGSLIDEWIEAFWDDALRDRLKPFNVPSDGTLEVCRTDPGFFGSYAVTNPEEDFAEAFSAFVFDLAVDTGEQQEKIDWLAAQPGLLEFRDRAVAAGIGPLGEPVHEFFGFCGGGSFAPADPATYGDVSLATAPITIEVTSGGRVDAFAVGCDGWASAAPALEVDLTTAAALLRFSFTADDGGDTTLIVNDPAGEWHCGDDSFGTLDPTIDLTGAQGGIYDVWVGSYDPGVDPSGTLTITP